MTFEPLIVLRHGELFLKGANRSSFERLLERNLRRVLARHAPGAQLSRGQGRCFVRGPQDIVSPQLVERLRGVFGLSSVSLALTVDNPTIENLAATALAVLEQRPRPRHFKVVTQRSDKRYPLTSPEISQRVGAAIVAATQLPVDLHAPECLVEIEIGATQSFVTLERQTAAGGLPVGSSGAVLLLLSGGIDSPVAGQLLQKRGCTLQAVHFHSPPHTSARARDKVQQLAALLAPAQGSLSLHQVHFTEIQTAIRDHCPSQLAVVLYRRMMLRLACTIARRTGCAALGSGENLGQVASQTLENLACIEAAADLPVLRPLLSFDKQETIAIAKRLGSYAISILPHDDCCSLFVPRHPATRSSAVEASQAEGLLTNLPQLLEAALGSIETVTL